MTDKIWEEIVDEESQALGVEATYIRLVSRRSIDKVLASISEQGTLTDAELVSWIDENWLKRCKNSFGQETDDERH